MRNLLFMCALVMSVVLASCGRSKTEVDFIFTNATVITMDGSNAILESIAVKDGKIVGVGTDESIATLFESDSVKDMTGKFIYPGFIDGHAHFEGYAIGLRQCNLVGTKSWSDVLKRVKDFIPNNKLPWIVGRGWDQNDWTEKAWPDRYMLDSLYPQQPVLLERIDGHAAIANGAALRIAGINDSTIINGGELLKREDGSLSGVLIDNAVDLVKRKMPEPSAVVYNEALNEAQNNCFRVGLTSVVDAGLMHEKIKRLDQLQKDGRLKIRIYAMLSDSQPNYDHYLVHGPYKTDRMNVRSFKLYADGALGSRGACLLESYSDRPGYKGLLLNTAEHFEKRMRQAQSKGFQVNTHCIGDSANRLILQLYGKVLKDDQQRWRIEHAQIVNPADIPFFKKFGVIPSVQPVHATSDMYWAESRIGAVRMKHAYSYKTLIEGAGIAALGTDFPVEDINPLNTFYAAVARKNSTGIPPAGFIPEEKLDRLTTLKGMTIWAAYANFEEQEKGSIEPNKFADFTILDRNLLTCKEEDILKTRVLATFINGELVFSQR